MKAPLYIILKKSNKEDGPAYIFDKNNNDIINLLENVIEFSKVNEEKLEYHY